MQSYKIKRAGREFVVYAGENQVLKCANRLEAKQVIRSVRDEPVTRGWLAMKAQKTFDFAWIISALLLVALVLLYSFR